MKNIILQTNNLTKIYKNVKAVDQASLSLEKGKIYGLIGQNGAGKTTFMRLIVGLAFKTSGEINLFGKSEEKLLTHERKKLGTMIENPSFYGNMTAMENMDLFRIMHGIPNQEIGDELLTLVGLSDTGKKKAKNFSFGMKQRLGIAISLINNPELLILDEPINGLDPIGVVEIRNLLKNICIERQMTILISSHNLAELYHTASDYIIMHQGRILEQITATVLDEHCKQHLLISCDNPEKLVSLLELELNTSDFKIMPDKTVKVYDLLTERKKIAQTLFDHGIVVDHFSLEGDSLENYFISIIGGSNHV